MIQQLNDKQVRKINSNDYCEVFNELNSILYIVQFFYSMFFKKKRSTSELNQTKQQYQVSPLPKLQELTKLEAEMISILGKKNIMVDPQADIFTRLEQIYMNSLQSSALGMQMLEKCLRIIGEFDSPIRVKFLYFYGHEMKLKGAAVDEVQPVLLESFHSNLSLKSKVQIGFKSGLTFCQISQHSTEVDKILSSLIVSLEEQLGYKPHKKLKAQSIQMQATKAIYLGTRFSNKSLVKHAQTHNKIQRLEYYKYLFQAFITGSIKIKSEAKRKYYADCSNQLKKRIIREYPGIEIDKKLNRIEEVRFNRLAQFGQFFKSTTTKEPSTQNRSTSKAKLSHKKGKSINRSKSEIAAVNSASQSLKNSFCRQQEQNNSSSIQINTWTTPSTPSKPSGFKFHLRKKSKHKINQKELCQTIELKQEQLQRQQPRPEITKLVFKQIPQNTKGIVLKFDRLVHGEVKKKKLTSNFRWQKQKQPHKQNQLQHVLNVVYLPQIKEEVVCQKKQTSIKQQSILETKPILKHQTISQSILAHQTIHNNRSTNQLNSSERIDLILEEGVEWVSKFESQLEYPSNKPLSSHCSECNLLDEDYKQQQQQGQAKKYQEQLLVDESFQIQKSYKIVIKTLQKPQINIIVLQQIERYFSTLNQLIINKQSTNQPVHQKMVQNIQNTLKQQQILQANYYQTYNEASLSFLQQPQKINQTNQFASKIVYQWLHQIEEQITNQIAHQAYNNFVQSCVQVYLLNLNQEVQEISVSQYKNSLKQQLPIAEQNQQISSFDDNDKDSQISSSQQEIIQNQQYKNNCQNSPYGLLTPSITSDKNQLFSQFSKIQMQRQTGQQWRSQMNLMNQFFISDQIQVRQNPKQITDEQSSICHQKEINKLYLLSKKNNSKTESQIQSKENMEFQITTRSGKKQSTHICLTIRYDEDYDTVTQQSKTFKHWLVPQLNIKSSKVTFSITYQSKQYAKEEVVPSFVSINDDILREITVNLEKFLIKYPNNQPPVQNFSTILKEFYQIDLFPQQVQIKPFQVVDEFENNSEIRCIVNIKQNRINFESQDIGVHSINLKSKQQLQRKLSQLSSKMMFIKNKELIIKNTWCYISQRNIKLFEKSYNSTHHFVFDFLQKWREDLKFDYEIRQQNGQYFSLQGIEMKNRGKIIKNVDTIIGYCLKIVKDKVEFHTEGINLFLNIL